MGVVHLAQDPVGNLVAIKVLHPWHPWGAEEATARRRLAREVETMRRVRSPFVAEVLDADVTGEFPYIVTRYVRGPTLEEMVRSRGPLSGGGLRRLAFGTAEALTAIHAAGVVHRDLKPGNVMLTDDRPVVIDFGIAQAGDSTRLTQTGLVMGTPGYLAPEVIEGRPSSPASDVHSWGATLAFAATGRPPYGGGSYETIFYRIVSGRADLDGAPAPLLPLLSSALSRDPAHRPSADWLSAQASSLDPSAMNVSLPAESPTKTAVPIGAIDAAPANNGKNGNNARKNKKRAKGSGTAYPAPKQAARDVADLLPPVGYAPFPPPGAPAPAAVRPPGPAAALPPAPGTAYPRSPYPQGPYPQGPHPQNPQAPQAPPASRAPQAPHAPNASQARSTTTGLALMVAAVAVTVVLPVAGLLFSLAVITLLRAADQAQSALAVRRSVRGPRASDLVVVVITAPLSVAKALLVEALFAPAAFALAAAVYAITLAATHSLSLPRAGSYAAAAVVAWYGIGPGSRRPRRQLNRMAGAVSRTRLSAAVIIGVAWAVAAAAVIFAASQAPYYWPATTPQLPALHGWPFITGHLPRLSGLVSSTAAWLVRNVRA
jgi:serine/threonine protein kinase